MSAASHHVAVLGCGVIGLSTALAILEGEQENPRGTKTFVTIVSKEVPDLQSYHANILGAQKPSRSRHSAEYASVWAVSDTPNTEYLKEDVSQADEIIL